MVSRFVYVVLGDPHVQTSEALEGVFINAGDNPFDLINKSIKMLAKHKGTVKHIENKKLLHIWTSLDGALGMLSIKTSIHKFRYNDNY